MSSWRATVATCREALATTPTSAPLWSALAAALLAGQVFPPALTAANAALELDPDDPEAWFVRGTALARARNYDSAFAALQRVADLAPGCARAYLNLGNILISQDRMDEAELYLRRALALAPDLVEAHTSLGFLQCSRHELDAAIACHDRALALRPDFAEARGNRAAALLLAGDYARGWPDYEWRKHNPLFGACYWQSDQPEWRGESLAGRTLLVFCEQGFGDTIMCARFLPQLAAAGARLVVVCAPPLVPLLRQLPGIIALVPRGEPLAQERLAPGASVPRYDTWIDQMSLPRVLGVAPPCITGAAGYLRADPALVALWRARLPPGRKIGLVWAGNPSHSNDHRRSMPFDALGPILSLPNTHFVGLARGAPPPGPGVLDIAPDLTDFAQTAAALACLDLVVTVDTAVAHLAGATGVRALVLLPHAPEWRWLLGRVDTPWYDSLRLFRQPRPGDWGAPLAAAAESVNG